MAGDYFLKPLDQRAIDHLIALLKRGYVFSTGDRGARKLAYTPAGGFTASFIDNVAGRATFDPRTEAALREHLAREPRHLYDTFIVDGLVREAYLAFETHALEDARRGFLDALALDIKVWAPHLGLCLVCAAHDDLESARDHLTRALDDFSRPFFHFYRTTRQRSPKGDPENYVAFLAQIIAIAPACAPAYKQRADAHQWAGDDAAARADLAVFERLQHEKEER